MQSYVLHNVLNDYHPFGMVMPGRSLTSESYRYGFSGMEKDGEEWTGNEGSHLDFGARIYDSRLGRFLSVDPHAIIYPGLSAYSFVGNMPTWAIDPTGKDIVVIGSKVIYDLLYELVKSTRLKTDYIQFGFHTLKIMRKKLSRKKLKNL